MKKSVVVTISAIALLLTLPVSADNQQRFQAAEPVTVQLYWVEDQTPSPSTMDSFVVPAGKIFVIETVSTRVLGWPVDYSGTELPRQLLLSLDGEAYYFVPLTLNGYCDETGFDCGDTPRPFFVGAENVRLYVKQEVKGLTDPGGSGTIVHILLSGYLLPENSAALGP